LGITKNQHTNPPTTPPPPPTRFEKEKNWVPSMDVNSFIGTIFMPIVCVLIILAQAKAKLWGQNIPLAPNMEVHGGELIEMNLRAKWQHSKSRFRRISN